MSECLWGDFTPVLCTVVECSKTQSTACIVLPRSEGAVTGGKIPAVEIRMGLRDHRIVRSFPAAAVSIRIETRSTVMAPDHLHTDDS